LVQAFFSIDEHASPDFDQASVYTDANGVVHYLYRTIYRATRGVVERAIAVSRLDESHYDDMYMWCEMFTRLGVKIAAR